MQRKATDIFGTILVSLSTDEAVRAFLQAKLEDYHQRKAARKPEVDPDPTYKWDLLNELLTKGSINIVSFERRYASCRWHNPHAYWNAVAVITAYNTGQTEGMFQIPMNK